MSTTSELIEFNSAELKKLPNHELLTHFESITSSSARGRATRNQGYMKNILRQEILFRMKKLNA